MMFAFSVHAYRPQQPIGMDKKIDKSKTILRKDSSQLAIRTFDENAIKKYRTQRDFKYDDVAPQSESLWDRFWRWFWRIISGIFSGKIAGSLIKYVLTGVIIILAAYIIIKLIGLDYKLFVRKSKTVVIPFEENLENIHEIDFDEQIEKAILSLNYRLAVRLLYLKTLKQLSDLGLIAWQLEKTNQTYVRELSDDLKKEDFAALTYQFEYIWYGDFFIDKGSFKKINDSFTHFNAKLA